MERILKITNLQKNYHTLAEEIIAVKDVSIDLYDNEFISLVGPSGCGKSTILSMLSGLEKKSSGDYIIYGKRKIGYMLQDDCLLEYRTILENCLIGLEIQNELTNDNINYVKALLKSYGLEKFMNSKPSNLSGGMRQRVV